MFTKKQEEVYNDFAKTINNKETKFLSSKDRAWGKSYVLNELGFELQALGYRVFLLTEFPNSQEHFATDFIDSLNRFKGLSRDKTVVIVDEYRYRKTLEILEYCTFYKIPMVGFVDYSY